MVEGELNAVAQSLIDCGDKFWTQSTTDGVAPKWQRQAGHLLPPSAEIDNAVQSGPVIGQLAFMDDESSFVLAFEDLRNNLVEGHNFCLHSWRKQLQGKIGGGE